jgi:hypothetical protein
MRGLGSHWSASLLVRFHPVRSFWLRRVSARIQSTMMWYRNAARAGISGINGGGNFGLGPARTGAAIEAKSGPICARAAAIAYSGGSRPPLSRHSPDSRVVERDFPSHRGALQRNSIATASVRSQIAGLPASQCWNSLLCLHQGAPLPSPSVASDPHLPVMPVPVAPAAGRSTTGFPGTSALAPRPRPFGRLRSGRG